VLPNSAANHEKLERLATAIRNYKGQASVVQVQAFDDLPEQKLKQLFMEARSKDYASLLRDLKRLVALSPTRRPSGRLSRLRRRFQEISAIDFFQSPLRGRVEALLARSEESDGARPASSGKSKPREHVNRVWMTRPRPGIDRVSSAWLIRRFVDPQAEFLFVNETELLATAKQVNATPVDALRQSEVKCNHRSVRRSFEAIIQDFGKS